ncbi:MAG TPA: hypothetical protein VF506_06765, partial [Streptosporangiaceae bacterium]
DGRHGVAEACWRLLATAVAGMRRDQLEASYKRLLVERAGGSSMLASGPLDAFSGESVRVAEGSDSPVVSRD